MSIQPFDASNPEVARLKARLASAEAEVARLKALLEAKRPYEPKVGDVATPTPAPGQVWEWADGETGEWVLVRPEPDWESHGRWFIYSITYDCMTKAGYFGIDAPKDSPSVAKKYLRPATPAERAAAGLPPEESVDTSAVAKHGDWLTRAADYEAPAKPEVLPEHLAFLDAMAAERTEESHIERPYAVYRTTTAARALLAAVARRDGGAK